MALKLVGEGKGFERYCPTFSKIFSPLVEKMVEQRMDKLAKRLGDENADVRWKAGQALKKALGNEKSRDVALVALVKHFECGDSLARGKVTDTLRHAAKNGIDISAAVLGLVKYLGEEDAGVRLNATEVLGKAAENGNRKTLEEVASGMNGLVGSKRFVVEAEKNSKDYIEIAGAVARIMETVKKRLEAA